MAFELTWSWIIASVGVLAIVLGIAMEMKKKKRQITVISGIVLGVVGLLAVGGVAPNVFGGLNSPLAVTTDSGITQIDVPMSDSGTSSEVCPAGQKVSKTTVTITGQNTYTSVASGGSHRYRINGNPALTVADAGTFTASPGNSLDILFMNETSTSYFGAVKKLTVPCDGTKTFSEKLYQNGTITIKVYNEDQNSISGTTGETLGAGDVTTYDMEIQGQFQKAIPYGGVMVVEYNSTEIDDAIVELGGVKTTIPSIFVTSMGISSDSKAYTIPAFFSNDKLKGKFTVDADDTNNPSASNISLTFYPNDYFINEDNGGAYEGPAVEDEDDVQTFPHTETFTFSVL